MKKIFSIAVVLAMGVGAAHASPPFADAPAAAIDAAQFATDAGNAAYDAANSAMDSSDATTAAFQDASDSASAALAALASGEATAAVKVQTAIANLQTVLNLLQNQKIALATKVYAIGIDSTTKTLVRVTGIDGAIAKIGLVIVDARANRDYCASQLMVSGVSDTDKANWTRAVTAYNSGITTLTRIQDNLIKQAPAIDASIVNVTTSIATLRLKLQQQSSAESKSSNLPSVAAPTISDGNSPSDIVPEETVSDSVNVEILGNKKSRISIESNFPLSILTVTATKRGVKTKLSFKIKTKADGSYTFTTASNLRGYTVILLQGKTELDRLTV